MGLMKRLIKMPAHFRANSLSSKLCVYICAFLLPHSHIRLFITLFELEHSSWNHVFRFVSFRGIEKWWRRRRWRSRRRRTREEKDRLSLFHSQRPKVWVYVCFVLTLFILLFVHNIAPPWNIIHCRKPYFYKILSAGTSNRLWNWFKGWHFFFLLRIYI